MVSLLGYASGLLGLAIVYFLISPFLSPLRSVPGPFIARFTKLWFLNRLWHGHFDRDNIELHKKYGRIVRYGPNHYSVYDPEAIKLIYGHSTEFDKSTWYNSWDPPGLGKSLFTERSVKEHGQLRRKFQQTFSMSSMVSYETFVDKTIALFCKKLEEIAKADGKADMWQWFLCYAADSVSMITFGNRLGFLDKGEDVGEMFKTLHGNIHYATLMGVYDWLHPYAYHFAGFLSQFGLSKGNPRMILFQFIAKMTGQRIQERSSHDKPRTVDSDVDETAPKDFLDKFLDFNEADSNSFTDYHVRIGLSANVIAGSDTTASTLCGILLCLLKNPSSIAKLRAEVVSHRKEGKLSTPPTFKEAQALPYLQAVIQEAARVYPVVGLPLQRVVPPGPGAEICGYRLPPGTVVGVNPWVMHYDASVYGEDVNEFRPERWLEADKDRLAAMNRNWAPFGLGSRNCIGKHVSMLEITKLMPELVTKFDIELEGDNVEWVNYWFVLPESLPVKLKLRSQEA